MSCHGKIRKTWGRISSRARTLKVLRRQYLCHILAALFLFSRQRACARVLAESVFLRKMWAAAAAASTGFAILFKVRGQHLANLCEKTLDDLEAAEDELDLLNSQVNALTAQVKDQMQIVAEVSGGKRGS